MRILAGFISRCIPRKRWWRYANPERISLEKEITISFGRNVAWFSFFCNMFAKDPPGTYSDNIHTGRFLWSKIAPKNRTKLGCSKWYWNSISCANTSAVATNYKYYRFQKTTNLSFCGEVRGRVSKNKQAFSCHLPTVKICFEHHSICSIANFCAFVICIYRKNTDSIRQIDSPSRASPVHCDRGLSVENFSWNWFMWVVLSKTKPVTKLAKKSCGSTKLAYLSEQWTRCHSFALLCWYLTLNTHRCTLWPMYVRSCRY